MFLTDLLAQISIFAINTISSLGYFGIYVLMILESMVIPIPSELVMPFAGFLAADGTFNFWLVVLFSTLGSITGSLISYYIGKYGGEKIVLKYGKYMFLDVHDLKKTEKWFKKSGEKTIFIGRLIPVVRHLISIPAGIGKMDIKKFCIYTVLGAALWNFILTYLGYVLGKNWDKVRHYTEPISIIVAILLMGVFVYFIYRHIKNKKEAQKWQKNKKKKSNRTKKSKKMKKK
jgi:membrane protein DedA with SNARE-associated domain